MDNEAGNPHTALRRSRSDRGKPDSSPFRRDRAYQIGKISVGRLINRPVPHNRSRRKFAKVIALSPVMARPDGPGTKTTATIRTHVAQNCVDATTTESAFKRTNHRVGGIGRKSCFAVFADWP